MDDMMGKMQSLLSDPESVQQLQELAQMLQSQGETANPSHTTSDVPGQQVADVLSAPAVNGGGLEFGGLDMGMLMKLSRMLGTVDGGRDTALLLALKPHLKAERQQKVERAVKFLKLFSLYHTLKENGMLKDFFR